MIRLPGLPFPIWAVVLVILLICAALLQSGAFTQADAEAVLGNLFSGAGTLLVIAMAAAAGPVILLAVVMLMHDRTKAVELFIAGLTFAVVAGLWHFGFWGWVTSHGGTIASHLWKH
jgi:hypothetical protein